MRRSRDIAFPWTSHRPLLEWFSATIRGARFRTDIRASFCCDPDRVINIAVPSGTGSAAGLRTVPLWPLALLVHEARHIDVGPHTCGTLDRSIAELGAFGVQYELLHRLALDPASPLSANERLLCASRADAVRVSGFCSECR
jgi:hypothetical protein